MNSQVYYSAGRKPICIAPGATRETRCNRSENDCTGFGERGQTGRLSSFPPALNAAYDLAGRKVVLSCGAALNLDLTLACDLGHGSFPRDW